ncbi:hypothetical protein PHYPSEUDO_014455 [Phytophthora pseudosyringae]|uniref:Uncharacterized protein n=1 Tax=Phytophthora pseudosyringae TaxID=221518 RepID=A0A8T1V495_9STRA|nr:hypothetical protein PHYPSEUDO_014455 [Phytophthora pseudosyringae]
MVVDQLDLGAGRHGGNPAMQDRTHRGPAGIAPPAGGDKGEKTWAGVPGPGIRTDGNQEFGGLETQSLEADDGDHGSGQHEGDIGNLQNKYQAGNAGADWGGERQDERGFPAEN